MKLIVSTFLVYKVKKCLLKSGKVSSSDGPSMPFGWSFCARYTGIRSPPSGHQQPLCWATTAHKAGNECPNIGLIFGQYFFDSLRYLKRLNWIFACFVLSLMILLWFLMILLWYFFLLFARSLISYKYLYINNITWYLRLKMRLWDFFLKKYIRMRKEGLRLQKEGVSWTFDTPSFHIYSAPWWFSQVT